MPFVYFDVIAVDDVTAWKWKIEGDRFVLIFPMVRGDGRSERQCS
jgi:hypothetical protein